MKEERYVEVILKTEQCLQVNRNTNERTSSVACQSDHNGQTGDAG